MQNKIPDLIGQWEGWLYNETFLMYVDATKKMEDTEVIAGRILDSSGLAYFLMEKNPLIMEFAKVYEKKAIIETKAAKNGVKYQGMKMGEIYTGIYTVINGIRDDGSTGDWTRKFWVQDLRTKEKNYLPE